MFIINFCLNMFRASLLPIFRRSKTTSRTETFTVLTSYNAAPHNRYQPLPAEPEQYTKCSNTVFVLLKMGIWCPKHVETEVDNKHLIFASCLLSLSSHFIYSESLFVAWRTQHEMRILHIVICGLSCSSVLSTLSQKRKHFRKKKDF